MRLVSGEDIRKQRASAQGYGDAIVFNIATPASSVVQTPACTPTSQYFSTPASEFFPDAPASWALGAGEYSARTSLAQFAPQELWSPLPAPPRRLASDGCSVHARLSQVEQPDVCYMPAVQESPQSFASDDSSVCSHLPQFQPPEFSWPLPVPESPDAWTPMLQIQEEGKSPQTIFDFTGSCSQASLGSESSDQQTPVGCRLGSSSSMTLEFPNFVPPDFASPTPIIMSVAIDASYDSKQAASHRFEWPKDSLDLCTGKLCQEEELHINSTTTTSAECSTLLKFRDIDDAEHDTASELGCEGLDSRSSPCSSSELGREDFGSRCAELSKVPKVPAFDPPNLVPPLLQFDNVASLDKVSDPQDCVPPLPPRLGAPDCNPPDCVPPLPQLYYTPRDEVSRHYIGVGSSPEKVQEVTGFQGRQPIALEPVSPWTPAHERVTDLRRKQPMTPCTPWTPAWDFVDTPIPTPLIHEADATNSAPKHFDQWPSPDTSFADENALDPDGARACVTALPSIVGLTPLNLQAFESEQDVLRMRMEPQSCNTVMTYSTDSIASHRTPCCSPDKIQVVTPCLSENTAAPRALSSVEIQGASLQAAPRMVKDVSRSSFGSESIDTGRPNFDDCLDIGAPPQRPVRRASVPPERAGMSSVPVERRNSSPAASGGRVAALRKQFENIHQVCTIKTVR